MSHSSLLPSTSGCVHVWHTRKTSPQATAQGLSGVCYGVGGIVLSRLRCNFQEEKQIQRMLPFPVIGSGAAMVEGFLFLFLFFLNTESDLHRRARGALRFDAPQDLIM